MKTSKQWELIVSKSKSTAHFIVNTDDLQANEICFSRPSKQVSWQGTEGKYVIDIDGIPDHIEEMILNGKVYLALKSDIARKIREFKIEP